MNKSIVFSEGRRYDEKDRGSPGPNAVEITERNGRVVVVFTDSEDVETVLELADQAKAKDFLG